MEEKQGEYVVVPEPTACSSHSMKDPVIRSKRKASASSERISRKHFEVGSPFNSPRKSYVDNPSIGAVLRRESSRSRSRIGCDLRAPPILTFSKKK